MRKAFAPGKGPLANGNAEVGEQQGLCDLFAGAIGVHKNPRSHREAGIGSAVECAQLLILASHLLRIVEERVAARRG